MGLPPSLWPRLYHSITSKSWPPADAKDALTFVRACIQHRLLALLLDAPDLPETVRAMLPVADPIYRAQVDRTQLQLRMLSRLAEVLADETLILLKGCDYGFRIYPRPELRPMADIDFLVPRLRSETVTKRLRAAGAVQAFPAGHASRLESYHETFFRFDDVTVEPHHSFAQRVRYAVDYDAIWERRIPFAAGPLQAFRLHDEDSIVYAALSLSLGYFDVPLLRYLDFYLLLDRFTGDVAALAATSREWLVERAFFCALHQTVQVFPEIRPKVDALLNSLLSPGERRFLRERVLPAPLDRPGTTRRQQLWRKFHLMDRYPERIAFLLYHGYAVVAGTTLSMTRKE